MASRRLLLSPLVVFAAACAVSAGTFSAFTARAENAGNEVEAGSVHLYDNDGNSSLVGLTNAGAGASDVSCIQVTSDGSLASLVRLRAASTGALAKHLQVKITRGSGAAGFHDCSGFTADERDPYGLGNGVLYDGRISDLPNDWAGGISDPSPQLFATAVQPLLTARTNIVGMWELGERTRRDDDFAGVPGALLTSRAELLGSAWTKQAVSTTNLVFTGSGRVRPQDVGTAIYRVTGVTAAAELVTADVTVRSPTGEAGLMTRMPTTGDTGYLVRYVATTGTWQLGIMNAGVFTQLSSWVGAIAIGDTAHVALDQNGSSLRVLIDGQERMVASDSSIAASSRTGIRLVGSGPQDDGSGVQLDNVRTLQPNQASTVQTYGSAATATGAPAVVPDAQPSASDSQWAVNFNGTNQAMSLPATGLSTAATVAGWFRLTSGSAIMRDSSTGTTGWSLGYDDGDGHLKFRVSDEVFDTGVAFAPLRNAWHHHALVRNGSTVEYYLDGRRVFSGSVTGTTAPTSPWYLMRDGTGTAYSSGRVDHVGIWSRALASTEIAAIRDGIAAPNEWMQGDSTWYRVEVTVDEDPAAASSNAYATFAWEAHNK